jgi:hypothetical protein
MKKLKLSIVLLLMALSLTQSSNAQFFKNMVNNALQKTANKKAQQAVNSNDSTSQTQPNYDSLKAAMQKMYADTAGNRAVYNNYNAEQRRMAISPADSAAAISTFKSANGGSGVFYQYSMVYDFKQKENGMPTRDTSSMYLTEGGNVRNEIGMFGGKMVVIGHSNQPKYSIVLYPASHTYQLNIIDTALINSASGENYSVTKIGNETVMGYPCTHARLVMTSNSKSKTQITEDLWMSQEIPGYSIYKQLAARAVQGGRNVTPKMMQALEQAGCTGFIVKMQMQSADVSAVMQMITAEQKSFPASAFEIPAGYSKSDSGNMMAGMMGMGRK